jgi:hypothetical protein
MVFSRLANFTTRRRTSRAPIVVIDAGSADSGALWQSITSTPTQGGGLAPQLQPRAAWTVVGQAQAPQQQTALIGIYERLKLLSERETAWLFGHVHRNQRHLSQWK